MLKVHVECGRHPGSLRQWFPAPEPDPFFEDSVLTTLYGDGWTSILIEEDGHAWRHAFAASAIGTTGLRDIEPLLGYAGALCTPGAPPAFLTAALERYTALCRDNGIVAELMRFNPLLQNHRAFDGLTADLRLSPPKPVVYLNVREEDPSRMSSYPPATRNMVRVGYRSSSISILEKTAERWSQVQEMVARTLDATRAAPQWQLPPDLWHRLQQEGRVVLFGALQQDRLVSAAIALTHERTWYYLLAASVPEPEARRGASNALVNEMGRAAARDGASHLGLGGGLTGSMEDSLLAFKNSFGGDVLPFTVGFLTHDHAGHEALLQAAVRDDPSVGESPLFLRYRLAPAYSGGRMIPVPIRSLAGPTV